MTSNYQEKPKTFEQEYLNQKLEKIISESDRKFEKISSNLGIKVNKSKANRSYSLRETVFLPNSRLNAYNPYYYPDSY